MNNGCHRVMEGATSMAMRMQVYPTSMGAGVKLYMEFLFQLFSGLSDLKNCGKTVRSSSK